MSLGRVQITRDFDSFLTAGFTYSIKSQVNAPILGQTFTVWEQETLRLLTCFIMELTMIITWTVFTLVLLSVQSAWGCSPFFLTLLVIFTWSGFFLLDLSRTIWFWPSLALLSKFTFSSKGFSIYYDYFLTRVELCVRTTSKSFLFIWETFFEQLIFCFKNTYFTLKLLNFHTNRSWIFSFVFTSDSFCMYFMKSIHEIRLHCHNLATKLVLLSKLGIN